MNIVVTGASRGIGYEVVKQLSSNAGFTIFATARNAQKLGDLQKECENATIVPIICDLNAENAGEIILTEIRKHVRTINYILNNAGAIVNKPFMEISNSDMQYVYNVNVFSVVKLIQILLPLMDERTKAHIVNVSSIGGFQGSSKFAGLSAYSSSKAALTCLTECLAEEFKDRNIAFNCLALGAVQTEMLSEAFPGYKAPLSAQEMAVYISDFLLNAHKFLNGKIIPVSLSTP
ncbi:MAG: SDR family oxidoreductase [Bacteroidetes bacterium]|nr:SDR family oxidoreductase [Bacteroidota bacterium]